jgi:hypothetical protein
LRHELPRNETQFSGQNPKNELLAEEYSCKLSRFAAQLFPALAVKLLNNEALNYDFWLGKKSDRVGGGNVASAA